MQKVFVGSLFLFFVAFIGFLLCTFTVDEREVAIKFRFGEAVRADYQPGLHWKLPIVNTIKRYDSRIQTLDLEPEPVLSAEKKNLIVDVFVKWRISDDVTLFYEKIRGDITSARRLLGESLKDGLRREFAKRTIQEVISEDRGQIMSLLTEALDADAKKLGIKIIDVRTRKIDLPPDVSGSVYSRMEQERQKVAKELRSQGQEESEKIRAQADREYSVMIAEAYRDAEILRGEGDATAARTYADAYQKDSEFYAFYRSLSAYRHSLGNGNAVMVLEPDSQFFDYFKNENK